MSADKAIYQLIVSANTDASARVYTVRAPQNVATPFVVFQRISSERWRSINAPSGIGQALMQVDAYANSYQAARELAEDIENALDGYRGTVTLGGTSPAQTVKIGGITLQNDVDLLDQTAEPFLYRVSADYLVTYER